MSAGVPAGEKPNTLCLACCRTLKEHGAKRQCPETTYFIANRATPTPPIEGRDADVERVAIREYLIACADECDRQGSLYAQSGNVCAVPKLRAEAKAYRNAARMVDEQAHGSYRSAALQALGERS